MITNREYLKIYFGKVQNYDFRDVYANLESIYYDLLRKLPDGFYDKEAVFPPGVYITFWLGSGITLKVILDNTSEVVAEISENTEWEIPYSVSRSSGLPAVQPPFDLRIEVFQNNQKIETLFLRVREYALSVLATAATFEDVKNNILKQLISTYKGSVNESVILRYFLSKNYKDIGLFYDSPDDVEANIEKKIRLNEYFGDRFSGLRGILSDTLFPTIDRITKNEPDLQEMFSKRVNLALLLSKSILSSSFYRRSILGIDFYVKALKFVFGCQTQDGLLSNIEYALCDSAIIPAVASIVTIREEVVNNSSVRYLVFPNSFRFLKDAPLEVYERICNDDRVFNRNTLKISIAQLNNISPSFMYFGARTNPGARILESVGQNYVNNPLYANNVVISGGETLDEVTTVSKVFPNLNPSNQMQWNVYDVLIPMNLYAVGSKPSLYSNKAITLSGSMSVSMQSDSVHEIYSGNYNNDTSEYVTRKIDKVLTSFVTRIPVGFVFRYSNNNNVYVVFRSTGQVGKFLLQSPLVFRPYYLFLSVTINQNNLNMWKTLMEAESVDNRVVMQRIMLQVISTLWSFYKITDFVYPIVVWLKFIGDSETTPLIKSAIEGFSVGNIRYSPIVPNYQWEGLFGYFTLAEFSESFQSVIQTISDSGAFRRRDVQVVDKDDESGGDTGGGDDGSTGGDSGGEEPTVIYGVPSINPYTTLYTPEGHIPVNLPVILSPTISRTAIEGNYIYGATEEHVYKLEVLPTGQTVLRWAVRVNPDLQFGLYHSFYLYNYVSVLLYSIFTYTILLIDKDTGNIVTTYSYDDLNGSLVSMITDIHAVRFDYSTSTYYIRNLATSEENVLGNEFQILSCIGIDNSRALAMTDSSLMLFNTSGEILKTESYPANYQLREFIPSADEGTVGMVLFDESTNTHMISKITVLSNNTLQITPIASISTSDNVLENAVLVGDKVHCFFTVIQLGGW